MKPQSSTMLPLLLRDRHPVATANVNGADTTLCGLIRFFRTPIGTIVSAELHGAPTSAQAFDFCIRGSRRNERSLLSPLGISEDCLTCAFITRQFTIEDILGKTVEILEASKTHTKHPNGSAHGRVFSIAEAQ